MQPPYPAPVSEWHSDTYDAINPTRPELSQAGKPVIVTGAGQGIGQEIVKAFAQGGAKSIHILGRTERTLAETKQMVKGLYPDVVVEIHVVDIVDSMAVENAAKTIGLWDVFIANAGAISSPDLIEGSSVDEWWSLFEINIKGSYLLARALLPYKMPGGTIVGVSSGFAFLPASLPLLAKSSAYSISKMGTACFYEFLAAENPDLSVFVLHPGIVRTALYEKGELELETTLDTVQLPAHFSVWLASQEAKPLSGRFLFANWDVEELKTIVASRLKGNPVYLTTSLGGFPFAD
ncbi:NAD(P)-binding protein [Amniculicola lignicola CBS 123094]|uniref:NAD(P)-binding protein n=1 Tax=Amniculicola lignicola CBS 123094 TaxID=1392246 RepID=A0A6A5WF72_9PLEO|nr:NAD(P)-binding protein [Amniculicola lignicola CBS 123094]